MASREQTSPLTQALDPQAATPASILRIAIPSLGALALGVAWFVSSLVYPTIAGLENINDGRANQVIALHGYGFVALWSVGFAWLFMRGPQLQARGGGGRSSAAPELLQAVLHDPGLRRFAAICVGVSLATIVVAIADLAIAGTPAVLTPPAALLMQLAAGGIGGVLAIRALDKRARQY